MLHVPLPKGSEMHEKIERDLHFSDLDLTALNFAQVLKAFTKLRVIKP